jgi:hypothetical protein
MGCSAIEQMNEPNQTSEPKMAGAKSPASAPLCNVLTTRTEQRVSISLFVTKIHAIDE